MGDLETLQAVIDANEQGIFALDAERRYTAFNRAHATAMRELYGTRIAIGGRLTDYQTVAADREAALVNFEKALAGTCVVDRAFSGEDGRRRYFEIVHTPQTDAAGSVVGVVVRAYEVTAREQAEAALRQSEAMRTTAEQVAHVGAWRWDLPSGRSTWSQGMYRLFDVDADELDGDVTPMLDARVHPDDRASVDEAAAKAAATGQSGAIEYRVLWRDGTEHILRGGGEIECDADGAPIAIVGFEQDVTEQRLAEAALRMSQVKYRTVADNTYDWEWWAAPDGKYAYVSPACERITGRTAEEFVADPDLLLAITHPDDVAMVREHIQADVSHRPVDDRLEFRIFSTTDDERVIEHRCQDVVDGDGAYLGRRGSNRDITERKRGEAEIRRLSEDLAGRLVDRTRQLDAANREVEGLAYAISHDVRAPLRAIDGFCAIVLADEGAALTREARKSLGRVCTAGQTMARLMNDLLGLSNVSRRDLLRRSVDMSALAGQVVEEVAADHPLKSVETRIEPGLSAEADPALTRIILRELLDNAWKFTAEHDFARVEVGALDADGERAFYVRDDGAGFDMALAEHLFGVFQHMHLRERFPGDAVGLATVQRLVRRHGGRVWAEAQVEGGATFYFTLPAPTAAA